MTRRMGTLKNRAGAPRKRIRLTANCDRDRDHNHRTMGKVKRKLHFHAVTDQGNNLTQTKPSTASPSKKRALRIAAMIDTDLESANCLRPSIVNDMIRHIKDHKDRECDGGLLYHVFLAYSLSELVTRLRETPDRTLLLEWRDVATLVGNTDCDLDLDEKRRSILSFLSLWPCSRISHTLIVLLSTVIHEKRARTRTSDIEYFLVDMLNEHRLFMLEYRSSS